MIQIIVAWQVKVRTNKKSKLQSIKISLANHQIIVLLIGSITISILLTALSLWLYTASGTQQLDLSRPGYKSVQDKVQRDPVADSYPASGPMSVDEIEKFKKLYGAEIDKINQGNAFSGDPLNPENLGISLDENFDQEI